MPGPWEKYKKPESVFAPGDIGQEAGDLLPEDNSQQGVVARAVNQFGRRIPETISGLASLASDAVRPPDFGNEPLLDSIASLVPGGRAGKKIVQGIGESQWEQFQKAREAGVSSEGAGHLLASVLPVVGPAAADIGEKIGGGQAPEAAGDIAFELASAVLPGKALGGARKVGRGLEAGARGSYSDAIGKFSKSVQEVEAALKADPSIMDTLGVGGRKKLSGRATAAREAAGEAVGTEVSKVAGEFSSVKSTRELMEKIIEDSKDFDPKKARAAKGQLKMLDTMTGGPDSEFAQIGDQVRYKRAQQEVSQRGGGYDKTKQTPVTAETSVAKNAAAQVRADLHSAVPDLAKADAAFDRWQDVDKSLRRALRKEQVGDGMIDTFSVGALGRVGARTLTGGAIGAALGGAPGGALGAATAIAISKSAFWNTLSGAVKRKLAKAINAGSTKEAADILDRAALVYTVEEQGRKNGR